MCVCVSVDECGYECKCMSARMSVFECAGVRVCVWV